eukprot:gnl/Hemi2/23541_TR7896_c0_g3_i1.p1 gnl/Hemi2/23541_TR7896_c0_g3~~gnl/Hemi2/23541_TR7896_c0_g3_i1.p1  ORF type:complete len:227 (+),score=85.32 gnl/Hemi2/23541_TR7896_c0_g3_i1:71-682(+)
MASTPLRTARQEALTKEIQESLAFARDADLTSYVTELLTDPECWQASRDPIQQVLAATCSGVSADKITQTLEVLMSAAEDAFTRPLQPDEEDDDDLDVDKLEAQERDGSCKLCGSTTRITIHHLIPKLILKRLKKTQRANTKVDVSLYLVDVCRPCHNELHRLWGHGELASSYQTVDMILEAPEIQPYLLWKRKKERTLYSDE